MVLQSVGGFSIENGLSEILGTHLASSHITFSASVHFVFLFLSRFFFVLRPHDSALGLFLLAYNTSLFLHTTRYKAT